MRKVVFAIALFLLHNLTGASAGVIREELHTGWKFRQARLANWYPATVPGTVHTDLMQQGIIEDPYFRLNERGVQWVDKEDWIYEMSFDLSEEMRGKENLRLSFKGLDTYADVYLNGEKIIEADNMFREWQTEISSLVQEKENRLQVCFYSPVRKGIPLWDALPFPYRASNDQSENGGVFDKKVSVVTRKAGYHYGWDWGPRLVTSGIWRPVILEAWDTARIEQVYIRQQEVSARKATLSYEVEIVADRDIPDATLEITEKRAEKNELRYRPL